VQHRLGSLHSTAPEGPRVCVFLAWSSAVTLLLIAFCCWRLSAISDFQWPRSYPDHVLMWLESRYDAAYPSGPDGIKIHGELGRVRPTLWSATIPPLIVGLSSVAVLLLRFRHSIRPGSQREWLLLAMSGGVWIAAWTTRGPTFAYVAMQVGFGIALGFVIWAAATLFASQYAND
jgi:hypothetical protein